ncbi:MAG TPA: helix-turn-helix domain-containing protein [Solirubrobacteraceae bacterium]|nr:helix-turn-helix domain-containing protein [Solirubrobacteraceae bacterium]
MANPIRLRIVRHLSDREGASLDELAEVVSAQRNTVRSHLRALMSAGVVARTPGEPEGRLGRPPARYRLERRELPRGAAPTPGASRGLRSAVSVTVRDYPSGAPSWTLREPAWAAAVYLLESPWLSRARGRDAPHPIDYDRRTIDGGTLERTAREWPRPERLMADIAWGLWSGEARGPVTAVARALDPEQRARVLAAIALCSGDARVVGVSGAESRQQSA